MVCEDGDVEMSDVVSGTEFTVLGGAGHHSVRPLGTASVFLSRVPTSHVLTPYVLLKKQSNINFHVAAIKIPNRNEGERFAWAPGFSGP